MNWSKKEPWFETRRMRACGSLGTRSRPETTSRRETKSATKLSRKCRCQNSGKRASLKKRITRKAKRSNQLRCANASSMAAGREERGGVGSALAEDDRREGLLPLQAAPEEERPAHRPAVEARRAVHLDAGMRLRTLRQLGALGLRVGEAGSGDPAWRGSAGRLRIARRGRGLAREQRHDRVAAHERDAAARAGGEVELRPQRGGGPRRHVAARRHAPRLPAQREGR